jgi:hypothetical protein
MGLLSRCPFKAADSDCPLSEVRSDDVVEMKQLAYDRLSDEQIDRILKHHKRCECLKDNPLLRDQIKIAC